VGPFEREVWWDTRLAAVFAEEIGGFRVVATVNPIRSRLLMPYRLQFLHQHQGLSRNWQW